VDALTVLKQGMKLERGGLDFYLNAAERSDNAATKKLFRDLAADEVDHYNLVGRQYDAIAAGETWVAIPDLEAVSPLDIEGPIFPEGVQALAVLPGKPSDEDALLFALGAEMKSFELYSNSAKQVENAEAKMLFASLAAAEQQHFNTLMSRYEALFGYGR